MARWHSYSQNARVTLCSSAVGRLTGRPIAVNLLLPFVGRGDAEAAAQADVVVTFWGVPRRLAATTWIHQCGSGK